MKRKIAAYLLDKYPTSLKQICHTLRLNRATYYYKSVRDDSEVEAKLKALAVEFPTRGFDWYYLRIRSEGLIWNRKRVLRVYRKLKLGLRRKHKKRLNRPYQHALAQPLVPNLTWSMDFMSDVLEDGRKVRILTVIDDYNREALAIETGISIPSQRVVGLLDRLIFEHGKPRSIRSDNSSEFTSHQMADFCKSKQIEQWFIQPGKPSQNGYIERFNRTYREDILDAYLFEDMNSLNVLSQQWKDTYNQGHPHQSLGGMSPLAFNYARHKNMDASEKLKAVMNDALQATALTLSPPSMKGSVSNSKGKSNFIPV